MTLLLLVSIMLELLAAGRHFGSCCTALVAYLPAIMVQIIFICELEHFKHAHLFVQ